MFGKTMFTFFYDEAPESLIVTRVIFVQIAEWDFKLGTYKVVRGYNPSGSDFIGIFA